MTADSPASAASPGETPDETARAILDATVAAMGGDTRDGQRAMCERSVAAMTGGDVLLAQAGTGTGKSIAYLAAAAAHAAASGERAIISTATLALQRQILLKDAPAVLEEAAKSLFIFQRLRKRPPAKHCTLYSRRHMGNIPEG